MRTVLQLPFPLAKALIHQCEREFLLPRQIIARAVGVSLGEPIILQIPQSYFLRDYADFEALKNRDVVARPRGEQKDIFLGILSQIVRALPSEFAHVAPLSHGRNRKYFGHSIEEIENTGNNNHAARIPGTDWFTSVNNGANRKASILSDVMSKLRFSLDYTYMISWAPCDKFPRWWDGLTFKTV